MDPIYIVLIVGVISVVGVIGFMIVMRNQMVQSLADMDQRRREEAESFRQALDTGFTTGRKEAATQRQESQKIIQNVHEKLGVITNFQETVASLNENVSGVRRVFENPKQRGLFGESQLKDIVTVALPDEMYEFEHSVRVGEGKYVKFDCFLRLPDPPGPLGIDSKFPAELYRNIVEASTDDELREARKNFGGNIKKLIRDIASKYIIPNVTSEFALMFVPSEAIFAEIYSELQDVVKVSQDSHVYIVSPATLMASLNTIRSVVNTMKVQRAAEQVLVGLASIADQAANLNERAERFENSLKTATKRAHDVFVSSGKIKKEVSKMKEGNTELISTAPSIEDTLANGELTEAS